MRHYNTYNVPADALYSIEGTTINSLFQIAAWLSSGDILNADERRDLGQWMQARINAETQSFT